MQENPEQKTTVEMVYCEYAGRNIPVFYHHSGGALLGIGCPKSSCKRAPYCKAFKSPPPPHIPDP